MARVPSLDGMCISWHPASGRIWRYGICSIPIMIGAWVLLAKPMPMSGPATFVGWWFLCLPFLVLLERDHCVVTSTGMLRTRWMLLGIILLWQSEVPLSRYVAVTLRRVWGKRSVQGAHDMEYLALVKQTGKFRYLSYYRAGRNEVCSEARAMAALLSDATGLPIRDYPDALFTKKSPVG